MVSADNTSSNLRLAPKILIGAPLIISCSVHFCPSPCCHTITHEHTHSGSYLPLTHVQQGGPVTSSPGQFALEQFAIKKAPGTAVFPWQRLAAHVIDEQRCVDAGHKERSQLHTAGIHLLHLTDTHKRNITAYLRCRQHRHEE